jgi:hypothetical protein
MAEELVVLCHHLPLCLSLGQLMADFSFLFCDGLEHPVLYISIIIHPTPRFFSISDQLFAFLIGNLHRFVDSIGYQLFIFSFSMVIIIISFLIWIRLPFQATSLLGAHFCLTDDRTLLGFTCFFAVLTRSAWSNLFIR